MKKVSRRQELVFKKTCERILEGYGSGHGTAYRPWIELRRKNTSKISNQVQGWVAPLGRTATYLARGEYRTAILMLWLGVDDLREQYPIWPTPHPHPLEGAALAPSSLAWSKGLLEIARGAGIDHGNEVGTSIPYIATIDLAATVVVNDVAHLFLFALKPFAEANHPLKWRTSERLELERLYSKEIQASYAIIYSGIVPDQLAANLDQWIVHSDLSEHPHLRTNVHLFSSAINARQDLPIRDSVLHAAKECAIEISDAWVLYKHCAWHQHIDIDPRSKLLHSYPAPSGGLDFKKKLQEQFFGKA